MLAELPDLWDVNVASWENDSLPSRFGQEGFQEPYTAWVKSLTTKPVVGVGRYTSPDTMASLVRRGIVDLIGAARPSIADPFLPRKIEEGRVEDIRECIGCNICVSGDMTISPIRCTQNPTMGEEWRRGWHPERIAPRHDESRILVVGAGPAGLEVTRALGQRGYEVHLAEATRILGGRVARESLLPGLREWGRVRDWRVGQIERMSNVSVYRESRLTAEDVLGFGAQHVVIATGAHWRRDGFGRNNTNPIQVEQGQRVYTPDDVMDGDLPPGPVLLFDDDDYYLGSVMAELLVNAGRQVHLVTPSEAPAGWTVHTLEYSHIQKRLRQLGVTIHALRNLVSFDGAQAILADVWSGETTPLPCQSLLLVTSRLPNDTLAEELDGRRGDWLEAGIVSVERIGDALAPGAIVHATYSGHLYARRLGEPLSDAVPFRRQVARLESEG